MRQDAQVLGAFLSNQHLAHEPPLAALCHRRELVFAERTLNRR
jgi:hypothetical protein